MAERTITARLRLVHSEFTKPLDEVNKKLRGVGTEAQRTAKLTGQDFQRLGGSLADLGDSMTTRLTLPIVAFGAAATKMAGDFDKAFTEMQTLAGVSADSVAGLKDQVLELAGETGQAPQELAEALYFLSSSGLDAEGAMEALTSSAKASAAGMGDVATIADAVSSAMLGYAESGLTAAEATDVFVATARAGKVEPTELASQMGRLIPLAAELGISFQDVGASIAAMSQKGNDAASATTQMTAVMSKLMGPSQQAEEMLREVGLSVDDIRGFIEEDGVLGALERLQAELGGKNNLLKFLEDLQAKQGALALLGGDLEKTRGIFDDVRDSVGATDEAFGIWAESMGAKNAKAFAEFQVAMIRLGDIIAPIAADLLEFAANIAAVFAQLPDGVQKAIIMFAALLAAVGPLASAGGRLMKVYGGVMKVIDNWTSAGGQAFADAMNAGTGAVNNQTTAMSRLSKGMRIAGIAMAALGVAYAGIQFFGQARRQRSESFVDELIGDTDNLDQVQSAIRRIKNELSGLEDEEGKGQLVEVAGIDIYATNGDAERQDRIDTLRKSLGELEGQEDDLIDQQDEAAAAYAGTSGAMSDLNGETSLAIQAMKDYSDALRAQFDPLFAVTDALAANEEAQRAVTEAKEALNEAIANEGANSEEAAEAQRAYDQAVRDASGSALDLTTASNQLAAAIAAGNVDVADAKEQLDSWVEQGLITQETADEMGRQFDIAALKAVALGGTDPNVSVSANDRATSIIDAVQIALDNLDGQTAQVGITARISGAAQWAAGVVKDKLDNRATGGPVLRNRLYEVAEQGRAELLEMSGRTYLIPGSNGTVVPAGPMTAGAAFAPSGGDTIVMNFPNLITPDSRKFRNMVQEAYNVAKRKGRGINAA